MQILPQTFENFSHDCEPLTRWSLIGLCSSEKQRLHYVNPPHLTWVAVLLSSFVTSITGSGELVRPKVTCPGRSDEDRQGEAGRLHR